MGSFPRGCAYLPHGKNNQSYKPPNLDPQTWYKTLKKSIMVTVFMGNNWCIQRIREHFLPFTDFEYILEVTLSEPGWLVFLIFTWCMMTKGDNLGIDSMIYSELKSVKHAYSHCRLEARVYIFYYFCFFYTYQPSSPAFTFFLPVSK